MSRCIFGVHREEYLKPGGNIALGEVFAQRGDAVCLRTLDGAVWVSTTRPLKSKLNPNPFKLPATIDFRGHLRDIPTNNLWSLSPPPCPQRTYQEISLEVLEGKNGKCGILNFNFYNGAMDTRKCMELSEAILHCKKQEKFNVLILAGS